jgi:hypothetical protein
LQGIQAAISQQSEIKYAGCREDGTRIYLRMPCAIPLARVFLQWQQKMQMQILIGEDSWRRSGSMMLRQLHFSELDLVLHSRYTPAEGRTVFDSEEVKAVEARTTVLPPLPEDRSVPESHAGTCREPGAEIAVVIFARRSR